jgi:hypothetical protein
VGLTVGLGKHHGDDVDCLAVGEHVPHAWLGLRLGLERSARSKAPIGDRKQGTKVEATRRRRRLQEARNGEDAAMCCPAMCCLKHVLSVCLSFLRGHVSFLPEIYIAFYLHG